VEVCVTKGEEIVAAWRNAHVPSVGGSLKHREYSATDLACRIDEALVEASPPPLTATGLMMTLDQTQVWLQDHNNALIERCASTAEEYSYEDTSAVEQQYGIAAAIRALKGKA